VILGFKPIFVPKILEGSKIHTIRRDLPDRWKVGNKIHFATGIRTKNYNQFHLGECLGTQKIEIIYTNFEVINFDCPMITIDGNVIPETFHRDLARNDGFNNELEFYRWFDQDFMGKIIHWTNFKYQA